MWKRTFSDFFFLFIWREKKDGEKEEEKYAACVDLGRT